jgi:hypothetical protein
VSRYQSKEDRMDLTCSSHGEDAMCVYSFGHEI